MGNNSSDFREIMSDRMLEFAVRIMKLESILIKTYSGRHIFGQLFRSGSSSGANYQESIGAESRADFIHKTQIVLKEVRESNYWIKLINKSNLVLKEDNDLKYLLLESYEFIKIISSSLVTAKQNK